MNGSFYDKHLRASIKQVDAFCGDEQYGDEGLSIQQNRAMAPSAFR